MSRFGLTKNRLTIFYLERDIPQLLVSLGHEKSKNVMETMKLGMTSTLPKDVFVKRIKNMIHKILLLILFEKIILKVPIETLFLKPCRLIYIIYRALLHVIFIITDFSKKRFFMMFLQISLINCMCF